MSYFAFFYIQWSSTLIIQLIDRLNILFTISWIRVYMSYGRFIDLYELIHGYLTIKMGEIILSHDFTDISCTCSTLYSVNSCCAFEGKFHKNFNISSNMHIFLPNIYSRHTLIQYPQTYKNRSKIIFIWVPLKTAF